VFGEGPIDFLFVQGLASHVDVAWEYPPVSRFFSRLASYSRVILFDRRGTGASDPVPLDALPTWEDWTEDVGAVLDAVGSERAAIQATFDAGPMGMLFAATHPERASALILANTSARFLAAPDYPIGFPADRADAIVAMVADGWGTEALALGGAPSQAHDPEFRRWVGKLMRAAATPRAAAAQYRYLFGLDARAVLPLIRVPTMVMHRSSFAGAPIEHGRYLAEHIPGAAFVEVPGGDMTAVTDPETIKVILDHWEEFLTGKLREPAPDRVLATVLFTDVVGSTERASQLGDHRWKELLDRLDDVARGEIDKVGGRLVNTTGDGHLATFDGPGKAIRCARSLIEAVQSLGIQLRAGLHTGEVEVRGTDVGGIAVHIGARVASLAGPSEVLVSRTVTDLVAGSGIEFDDRGAHALKGVPGEWHLFSVHR
jgi:class 3 adenylate cyclase/pimeloyl-ACP methyl ester carboxylesterase